jgi:integrase
MSQNESISYPKIHQRFDGRIELVVYYQGKRLRLQNGKTFNINLKPNSFPESERLAQSNILAAQIYSKLLSSYNPLNKAVKNKLQGLSDLEVLLKAADKKVAQGVSKHYERQLKYTLSALSKQTNGEVSERVVKKVLEHFSNPTSYNTMRRSLQVLFNAARELGWEKDPLKGISGRRAKAKLNKPYNNTPALLKEIKAYSENLYLCCLLTYGCLLRPHREVRELTWGDFSEDLNYIRLSGERNKSGRNRIGPVPYYVKEVLKKTEDHLNIFSVREEPFDPDYFKGLWSRFRKRSKLLEANQTLYSFRHTGAIDVYKRTGSIEKLKAAMGHSNIMVSLTYLRGLDVAELKEEDMPVL